jgi:hypothetical protein
LEIPQQGSSGVIILPMGVSKIDVVFPEMTSHSVEDRIINNVAVYRVDFSVPDTDAKVCTLNFVTAIDLRDGQFYRTIFSPFE